MSDESRSPSLSEVIKGTVEWRLQELHTSMPGRIVSFDAKKCVADVQPVVNQVVIQEDGTVLSIPYAQLKNVPVKFEGGGGYRATFPVAKDDYCEIIFQESSIDQWRSNGGDDVKPLDARRFHLADAICRVGLTPNASPWTGISTTGATFGKDGGPQLVAREDKLELGGDDTNTPTDYVALASTTKSEIGAVRDTLNDLVTAFNALITKLSADNVMLMSHFHPTTSPGAPTGPSPTLVLQNGSNATPPAPVGDVKSAKVKSF